MNNHSYAYGHKLLFNSSSTDSTYNTLYINKIIKISLDNFPYRVDFHTNQKRTIHLCAKSNFREESALEEWIFVVDGVVSFIGNSKQKKIEYFEDLEYSDSLMEYWLIHIVLPMLLSLDRTYYFLHVGSVVVDNMGILFSGDSYAGKSTLTDFFLQKKHLLLSDDKLATYIKDEKFYAIPSHPYHRPYRKIEDLGIKEDNFCEAEVVLDIIYWLTPAEEDEEISIEEVRGIKKFEFLRYSTEMDIYVNKKNRFEYITQLANSIKIYELKVPHKKERLDEVYGTIIKHIKGRKS